VGGFGSCDLGLIHAQVRSDGGARRVDVGLEAGVDGAGVEVPPVPPTECRTLIIAMMLAWAEVEPLNTMTRSSPTCMSWKMINTIIQ
jgi:hypothetical protein